MREGWAQETPSAFPPGLWRAELVEAEGKQKPCVILLHWDGGVLIHTVDPRKKRAWLGEVTHLAVALSPGEFPVNLTSGR